MMRRIDAGVRFPPIRAMSWLVSAFATLKTLGRRAFVDRMSSCLIAHPHLNWVPELKRYWSIAPIEGLMP